MSLDFHLYPEENHQRLRRDVYDIHSVPVQDGFGEENPSWIKKLDPRPPKLIPEGY